IWVSYRSVRRAQMRLIESVNQALRRSGASTPATSNLRDPAAAITQSIDDAIRQTSTDKAQLLTIISSMSEGLIAIDHRQRILLSNRAAEQLLGLAPGAAGQLLWDVLHVPQVLDLVSRVKLTGRGQMIDLGPIDGRFLEITVARLAEVDRYPGLIIVAHDITEARRYEELRKEFVAN